MVRLLLCAIVPWIRGPRHCEGGKPTVHLPLNSTAPCPHRHRHHFNQRRSCWYKKHRLRKKGPPYYLCTYKLRLKKALYINDHDHVADIWFRIWSLQSLAIAWHFLCWWLSSLECSCPCALLLLCPLPCDQLCPLLCDRCHCATSATLPSQTCSLSRKGGDEDFLCW